MGKLTISMAMFNSYVSHYQRVKTTADFEKPDRGGMGFGMPKPGQAHLI